MISVFPPTGWVFSYPECRASDCSFFSNYGRQVSGVSIFLLGEVNVSCRRGGCFFLSLMFIFLLGGGGVLALFIYFSYYGVAQQQKGEAIFFVVVLFV